MNRLRAPGDGQKSPVIIMAVEIIKKKPKIDKSGVKRGAIDKLFEKKHRNLLATVADRDFWKMNAQLRKDYQNTNGFTKGRGLRHIARIPGHLVDKAEQIWGEDVFSNRNKFKEAFTRDEVGEWTLLVPRNTL